ncbi:LysE family transporter [Shimia sp. R11_0]|uniref:LysE family translocator n=1 Tax=Shimia sp. R11_0 TaxID=2821096 RepID=UPI001ADB8322|nr:LysE family transporter [Shimia sp. R11_0]MBO9479283.1 LysE family transporter [Shimia sp. R11_0]
MDLTHILAFNLALAAAIASPGPAFLISVKTTLTAGRRAGLAVGAGLGLMASLWTLSALLGLDVIFTAFPWAYVAVKTIGALYLLYIAYGMWKGARTPLAPSEVKPARHAFLQGLMINLMNPKSVLFAAAVLVVIFPPDMALAQKGLIAANQLAIELMFYALVAFGMSTSTARAAYLRAKSHIDRIAAVVLSALGLRLLFGR